MFVCEECRAARKLPMAPTRTRSECDMCHTYNLCHRLKADEVYPREYPSTAEEAFASPEPADQVVIAAAATRSWRRPWVRR